MVKPTLPPEAQLVFKGIIYEVYQWEQKMFDGSTQTFERLKRTDTVKIVPVLQNGNILLIKEEQPGNPLYTDIPSGRVENGESPQLAAARELREETGYVTTHLIPWFSYYPNGNIVWQIHLFIGKGLEKMGEPTPDSGEKITPFEISFEQFLSIPENPDFYDFRGGGLLIPELIKAQYDKQKRQELYDLLYSS